ncbi:MAG: ArdC family protein [Bacteroidetes bacterium]|nr:ArdC family protein [Bacteroidota bacterium]
MNIRILAIRYIQRKERGGFINKGKKGSWVIYWDFNQIADKNNDDLKYVHYIKKSIVFYLGQTLLYDSEVKERLIVEYVELIIILSTDPK